MEQIAAFVALHDTTAQAEQMVYEVWEDGEVTLTKGGDLYGRRSLHTVWHPDYFVPKDRRVSLPIDHLPVRTHGWNRHGCIQVKEQATVNAALEVLFGKAGDGEEWYV
jgi:hypothetical protein